jgi:hypothetical protein
VIFVHLSSLIKYLLLFLSVYFFKNSYHFCVNGNNSGIHSIGNSIGFWKEKWCGEVPFRQLFPNLFAKETDHNVVVAISKEVAGQHF